jgi:hypothetical protein
MLRLYKGMIGFGIFLGFVYSVSLFNTGFDSRLYPLFGFPLFFLGLGIYGYRLLSKIEYLKNRGKLLQANVLEVRSEKHLVYGMRYQVICQYIDGAGQAQSFESMKFPLIGGYSIDANQKMVDVYVDPENPNNYFVEPKKLIH